MSQGLDLGSPRLVPLILRAGLPAMAGLSLNALHQGVDAVWIGLLSAEAVAAIALSLPLLAVTSAVGIGLGSGAATLAGQALGRARPEEAGRIASAVALMTLAAAGLSGFGLWLWREPILAALGAPADLRPLASGYLAVMAVCAALGIMQILADFVAIGEGNSALSLRMLALCFGLNILLDPVAIFGLGWGVQGAAAATIAAQLVTLAVYSRHFLGQRGPVQLRLAVLRPGQAVADALRAVRIGLPEAAWNLLAGLAFVLACRAAADHGGPSGMPGGTEAIAATGIALRFVVMLQLPFAGFCLGARAVLAHAHGAGAGTRLREAERRIATLCAGPALLVWTGILLTAGPVAGAFTEDPEVAAQAAFMLRIAILPFPLGASFLARLNGLQARARPQAALALGLAPNGYLLIPLLLALPSLMGLAGIAASVALAAAAPGLWSAASLLPPATKSARQDLPT